ncbi:MAG: hypothetical protein Q7T21_08615 [Gallionella sp.]|nr:hypothetical protein [Gallionella sp.]
MPMLIEHIDAIARQKKHDVLYVVFHHPASDNKDDEEILNQVDLEWETLPIRQQIIDWLDAHGIGWKLCGHFANESLIMGYRGQLYIDLPYDKSLPAFQALEAFLEFPDGHMRFPEVTFFYCPLDKAMENAAHDEPGFWERWAENL